jgi:hypothetical protein
MVGGGGAGREDQFVGCVSADGAEGCERALVRCEGCNGLRCVLSSLSPPDSLLFRKIANNAHLKASDVA